MLLSLWSGPLPWVHVHGTLSEGGSEALASHLARFHAGERPPRKCSFGWHLHFILPWAALEDGPCPANGSPQDFRDVVAAPSYGTPSYIRVAESRCIEALAALAQPMTGAVCLSDIDTRPPAVVAPSEPSAAHFLQTFGVSFLGDLISVSRC